MSASFCAQCGAKLSPSAKFCAACGAVVPQEEAPTPLVPPPSSKPVHHVPPPPPPPAFVKKTLSELQDNDSDQENIPQPPRGKKTPLPPPPPDLLPPLADFPAISNPQRGYARTCILLGLLFGFAVVSVFLFEIDIMQGGGAIILIGSVLSITSFIVYFLFKRRADILDTIISGEGVLAHWSIRSDVWRRYTEWQFGEDKAQAKGTWIMIAVISVVVSILFLVGTGADEASIWVVTFLGGFVVFLIGVAYLASHLPYWRRQRFQQGQALIAVDGLWMNEEFHAWKGFGARLEAVELEEIEETQDRYIAFTYSMPARHTRQYSTVRVPVPEGQEETAVKLASFFDYYLQEQSL